MGGSQLLVWRLLRRRRLGLSYDDTVIRWHLGPLHRACFVAKTDYKVSESPGVIICCWWFKEAADSGCLRGEQHCHKSLIALPLLIGGDYWRRSSISMSLFGHAYCHS